MVGGAVGEALPSSRLFVGLPQTAAMALLFRPLAANGAACAYGFILIRDVHAEPSQYRKGATPSGSG